MRGSRIMMLVAIAAVLCTVVIAIDATTVSAERVVLEPLPGSAVQGCEQSNEGCYNMPMLTVSPGTTVTFSNTDPMGHAITSGTAAGGPTGVFDSGLVVTGGTYGFAIHETGTYDYYCMAHPWMTGQIIVAGEAPAPVKPSGTPDVEALEERIRVLEAKITVLEAMVERLMYGGGVQASTPASGFNATAPIHEALVYKFIEEMNNPTPSNSTAP